MDGSDPLTIWTVAPRMCQIYQTQPSSFGLFHCYDKETLPTHDPEDISDNIAGSPPTIAQQFVSIHQVSQLIHPYPYEVSLHLGDWYWNQGDVKSKENFKQLVDIIGSPSFRPDDIQNTKWASIDHALGSLATGNDLECTEEWLDDDAGWKCRTVTICIPFSQWSANPGSKDYHVSDFYCCSLLSIIRKQVSDQNGHHLFHYEPYELLWRHTNHDIKVYSELYTLRVLLDAHHELLESPPEPGCTLPHRIIALMFWSDAMQLTSFGDAKLWPLYVFFGNQMKYSRGQLSAKLCNHVAYFQTVSMTHYFKTYISADAIWYISYLTPSRILSWNTMEENYLATHFSCIVTENSSMLSGQSFLTMNLSMCTNTDLYSGVLTE